MNYIVTTDVKRRKKWEKLFGTNRLPVKTARPRLMCLPRYGEVLAYDLDASRLHHFAVNRFAHYVAKKYATPVDDIVVDNWPIVAENCKPARDVKPAVGFLFVEQMGVAYA